MVNLVGALSSIWDEISQAVYFVRDITQNKIVLKMDVVDEVVFRATSNVTQYPTESGINITDYKYDNPSVLTIRGVVHRNTILGAAVLSLLDKETAVKKLTAELEYYKHNLYLLEIKTKAGLRTGYTLQDYEIPENFDNFGLMEIEMTFKQFVRAGQKSVIPSDKDTVQCGIVRLLGLN